MRTLSFLFHQRLNGNFNRPFSFVDFVFPMQILRRYPGGYCLSKLDIFIYFPGYRRMICLDKRERSIEAQTREVAFACYFSRMMNTTWCLKCRPNPFSSPVPLVLRLKMSLTSGSAGSGPVHTKTIVNANASKRKLFYAFRPSVHTKTMKTLTVNA